MPEIIQSIVEVEDFRPDPDAPYRAYSGYTINTTEQSIHLLIDDGQDCCEVWGYFMTNDNTDEFIGAELLAINVVDTCLNVSKLNTATNYNSPPSDVMFVNLETSRGTLQFVAYNDHNGYYGHEARVISRQLQHAEVL